MALNNIQMFVGLGAAGTVTGGSGVQLNAGTHILQIIDLTSNLDVSASFGSFAPDNNTLEQKVGGLNGHNLMVFF
jgi:hypothetical protein